MTTTTTSTGTGTDTGTGTSTVAKSSFHKRVRTNRPVSKDSKPVLVDISIDNDDDSSEDEQTIRDNVEWSRSYFNQNTDFSWANLYNGDDDNDKVKFDFYAQDSDDDSSHNTSTKVNQFNWSDAEKGEEEEEEEEDNLDMFWLNNSPPIRKSYWAGSSNGTLGSGYGHGTSVNGTLGSGYGNGTLGSGYDASNWLSNYSYTPAIPTYYGVKRINAKGIKTI